MHLFNCKIGPRHFPPQIFHSLAKRKEKREARQNFLAKKRTRINTQLNPLLSTPYVAIVKKRNMIPTLKNVWLILIKGLLTRVYLIFSAWDDESTGREHFSLLGCSYWVYFDFNFIHFILYFHFLNSAKW